MEPEEIEASLESTAPDEETDTVKVSGKRRAIARIQSQVRHYIPEGRNLSEELIRERRQEAAYA